MVQHLGFPLPVTGTAEGGKTLGSRFRRRRKVIATMGNDRQNLEGLCLCAGVASFPAQGEGTA